MNTVRELEDEIAVMREIASEFNLENAKLRKALSDMIDLARTGCNDLHKMEKRIHEAEKVMEGE